ncbi:efflux RND transporter periplasmic adaptor subunit [Camelimonas sp. ID_303_24]
MTRLSSFVRSIRIPGAGHAPASPDGAARSVRWRGAQWRGALAPAVALAGLTTLAACNDKAPAKTDADRPVLVATVRYGDEDPARTLVATIRPRIESDHGFRVGGKVARRAVEVGQSVRAGDTLAVLDDIDLKLQAEQAEAELRAATGALTQATAAEKRAADLRQQGWSTQVAVDNSRAAAEEARGRIARAQRAVELTRNSISYARLKADADGVVTATLIEPGQVVAAGQPAIRIARSGEKEAIVAAPEIMLDRIRKGDATLALWARPDKTFKARLRELSPSADTVTRTYQARFSLPDADSDVQIGMTGTLSVKAAHSDRVARLPLAALLNQNAGPAVYVVKPDGAVALTPVQVKAYDSQDVIITGGVNQGDKVVAMGVHSIDPARKVRVVDGLSF